MPALHANPARGVVDPAPALKDPPPAIRVGILHASSPSLDCCELVSCVAVARELAGRSWSLAVMDS